MQLAIGIGGTGIFTILVCSGIIFMIGCDSMKIEGWRDKRKAMQKHAERRKYPRLPATYGAVATLGKSKFGMITDISRSGLAFRYIASGHKEEFFVEFPTISIAYNAAGFAMRNIPCQIIRDFLRTTEPYSKPPIKKTCCIQFDPLTPVQRLQLHYFIANFTEEASSRLYIPGRL
jgi:hypothetical protein